MVHSPSRYSRGIRSTALALHKSAQYPVAVRLKNWAFHQSRMYPMVVRVKTCIPPVSTVSYGGQSENVHSTS